jgi:MSHA biogenesis protein MshE
VEYRLDRVNQVQVMPKIGLDFARVLRTTLRQDPDVILVGEMRDQETVDIGLRAAITGHLVFSTLHTMSAIATVHRLLDMGAAPFMIASAVHAVIAQRLMRRVCDSCGQDAVANPNQLAWLTTQVGAARAAQFNFREGTGCTFCNLTGYRGRVAVYELLEVDRVLADAIRRGEPAEFMNTARKRPAYVPLVQSALELAAAGVTSLAEVIAVTSGINDAEDERVIVAHPHTAHPHKVEV